MIEYVADALDVLEAEAARGLPRLLNIGFHLRIVGRPGRFKAFTGVLDEIDRRRDRLFVATREEIARAFNQAFDRARPCGLTLVQPQHLARRDGRHWSPSLPRSRKHTCAA